MAQAWPTLVVVWLCRLQQVSGAPSALAVLTVLAPAVELHAKARARERRSRELVVLARWGQMAGPVWLAAGLATQRQAGSQGAGFPPQRQRRRGVSGAPHPSRAIPRSPSLPTFFLVRPS